METLMVHDIAAGQYRPATESELINAMSVIFKQKITGKPLTSPRMVVEYLQSKIGDLDHERFVMITLDTQYHLINYHEVFRGTINTTAVHPRELIKIALKDNAYAVIIAHNHPSGTSHPSPADELITRKLKDAFQLVDIRLCDHFVVTTNQTTSFSELGLL